MPMRTDARGRHDVPGPRRVTSGTDLCACQASFIRSLFVAVNDEIFYVREAAIQILGRLTPLNPAHVMPALRRMLVQVLTALEFGGEDKREKSSRLLQHIILASQNLIRPYVSQVIPRPV
jgi:FKBP12-rapamycin complex-associated protein